MASLALLQLYTRPASGAGYRVVVDGGSGLDQGSFGPGYPGYGLEYVHGCAMGFHHRHYPGEFSVRNWCSDVLGRECVYPYVADPYSDPVAALGFWPPYSAPIASTANMAARGSDLGIDEEPVVDAAGARGMKVAKVHPGTAAAKAGLEAGDVLHSINGYLTQQQGNLAWIIANAAPGHRLEIRLRSAARWSRAYHHRPDQLTVGVRPLAPVPIDLTGVRLRAWGNEKAGHLIRAPARRPRPASASCGCWR